MTHSGCAAGDAVERLLSEHLFFYQTQCYCCGSESEFFHPRSRVKKAQDPGSGSATKFLTLSWEALGPIGPSVFKG
jgi:hypothetical protein